MISYSGGTISHLFKGERLRLAGRVEHLAGHRATIEEIVLSRERGHLARSATCGNAYGPRWAVSIAHAG